MEIDYLELNLRPHYENLIWHNLRINTIYKKTLCLFLIQISRISRIKSLQSVAIFFT